MESTTAFSAGSARRKGGNAHQKGGQAQNIIFNYQLLFIFAKCE